MSLAMALVCVLGLTGAKLPRKGPLPAPRPDIAGTASPEAQAPSPEPAATDTPAATQPDEQKEQREDQPAPATMPVEVPAPAEKPASSATTSPADMKAEQPGGTAERDSAESDAARHTAWCKARYKSYDEKADSYRSFSGRVRPCLSPPTEPPPAPTMSASDSADAPNAAAEDPDKQGADTNNGTSEDSTPEKAKADETATNDDGTASPDSEKTNNADKTGDDKNDADKPEPPPPPPPVEKEDMAAYRACMVELKTLGAEFVEVPRIDDGNGCGIDKPIRLSKVLPGISVSPEATVRCETALELARMTRDFVIPAARVGLPGKSKLTSINQASSYVCRNRDSLADAKMSEHAKGNAIDIASLSFGKTTVPMRIIEPRESTIEASFQRAIDTIACLFFSTVLAPGSDVYHKDHMHLDVIQRSSGYRICQ